LLKQPDLLLLDEPTNHLDAETIDWLENHLKEYPGTVIISTHDRYFLDNITGWILELEQSEGIPFEGNYSQWLAAKLERIALTEKQKSHKRVSIEKELKWIRMNSNDRKELSRERLSQYEQLVAKELTELPPDNVSIRIAPAPKLGEVVVQCHDVKKGFGENVLMENLDFSLPRSAVVGIVGPNGAGKTTLFNMILGSEKPDEGKVVVGETVKIACVEQFRDVLDAEKTVHDEISEGKDEVEFGAQKIPSRAYCSKFGFKGSDQQKLVGVLSGGERNRLHLAKVLKYGGNVILLDEPTNDLDVNTLRMLEDAIHEFSGCLMVISHDRFFLNRVCTHLLVYEGEAKISFFHGNWEEYEAMQKKQGKTTLENRRVKHRRFRM
jgi:ATPase subunit of ABC transporter with duplicated ATPase domains